MWLGFGDTSGASSSKQLGSHCWGKRIIGIVPVGIVPFDHWDSPRWHNALRVYGYGRVPLYIVVGSIPFDCVVAIMDDWYIVWYWYMHDEYWEILPWTVNCLIYYLIMILSGRRGLVCWYCWHRWFAMILLYCHWLWMLVWDRPHWHSALCVYGYRRVPIYMAVGSVPLGLSPRLYVTVAFWDALWFLLLGVSSLCYVWMQIRARGWWTDRASMEGEDVYMWARCSRMFEDDICCILFCILPCIDILKQLIWLLHFVLNSGYPTFTLLAIKWCFSVYVF